MFYNDFRSSAAARTQRESPEVQELVERRSRFLSDHPYLQSMQDEIDRLMSTTLDPMIRLEILFMLMTDKLCELRGVFEEVLRLAELSANGS